MLTVFCWVLDDVTDLIVRCSIVMTIGALFMLSGLWVEAIGFAVILTAFVWLVALPFLLWGQNLKEAAPAMFALVLLVVVSTVVLMIGATFISDYGALDIILFAVILLGFVSILAIMCNKLGEGNNQKNIMKGAGIMAILLGIVIIGSLAMGLMAKAASIADPTQVLATVGILTLIILAIAGISIGLGFLSDFPLTAPFFWAGIGAMAAVAGIALLISMSILTIAKAVKVIADVAKEGPIDITGVMTVNLFYLTNTGKEYLNPNINGIGNGTNNIFESSGVRNNATLQSEVGINEAE